MMKSKKGADLSMNVIIIAAIALLVLVILAVLLFRSADQVNQGTGCDALPGGTCQYTKASLPSDGNWVPNPALNKDCGDQRECWIKLG